MHSFWSGSVNFGLVNIPVQVYSASEERELQFHFLHKKDHSPVRYAKICKKENVEIPYKELIRGYEYKKGEYVIITPEEMKNAAPEKTKSIDIVHFVDECDVDIMYADKPYYLKPDKRAVKAYSLLLHALKESNKVGIAQFVFRTKENVGVIKPYGDILVLNQLRFFEEIRDPKEVEVKIEKRVSTKETQMALSLISQLTEPFEIKKYKDTYSAKLLAAIKRKQKGGKIFVEEKERETAKVYNLMDALKASLGKSESKAKTPAKKKRKAA